MIHGKSDNERALLRCGMSIDREYLNSIGVRRYRNNFTTSTLPIINENFKE